MGIVDVFDALTTDGCIAVGFVEEACVELQKEGGRGWRSRGLVDQFVALCRAGGIPRHTHLAARRNRLMRFTWIAGLAAAGVISIAYAQVAPAPTAAARPGDWPMSTATWAGRGIHRSRRSPPPTSRAHARLTSSGRRPEWAGVSPAAASTTPLVVGGVMYVSKAKAVVALDAATGKEMWRHAMDAGTHVQARLAFWPGGGDTPAASLHRRPPAPRVSTPRRGAAPKASARTRGGHGADYNGSPTLYKELLLVGTNSRPAACARSTPRTGREDVGVLSIPQTDGARGRTRGSTAPGRDTAARSAGASR